MNDYAATATAEKRLREVLAARLPHPTDADMLADILLSGEIGIEYKPRLKAVFITIPVPEKAEPIKPPKPASQGATLPPGNDVADAPPWITDDARSALAAGAERAEAAAQQAVAALGTDIPCPPFEDVQLQITKATGACGSPVPCIVTFVPKDEPDNGYDDANNVG